MEMSLLFASLALGVIALITVFLPSTLAYKRKHRQRQFILAVNFCMVFASIWFKIVLVVWFLLLPYVFYKQKGE